MKIQVKIKGTAPLLMHKFTEAEPNNSRAKKVYIPEEEAEKVIYRNSDGKVFIPSTHFKGAMIKSGTDFIMKGKKTYKEYIKAGILFESDEIVLDQQEYEIHSCPVVINRSRVMRHRPMFKEWTCQFTFEIIDEMLNQTTVKEILEMAGKFKGVGDFRPEYGRFEVTQYKVLK